MWVPEDEEAEKIKKIIEYCKKCIKQVDEVIEVLYIDSEIAYERYLEEDEKFFGEFHKDAYLYLQDCIKEENIRKSVYKDILRLIEEKVI